MSLNRCKTVAAAVKGIRKARGKQWKYPFNFPWRKTERHYECSCVENKMAVLNLRPRLGSEYENVSCQWIWSISVMDRGNAACCMRHSELECDSGMHRGAEELHVYFKGRNPKHRGRMHLSQALNHKSIASKRSGRQMWRICCILHTAARRQIVNLGSAYRWINLHETVTAISILPFSFWENEKISVIIFLLRMIYMIILSIITIQENDQLSPLK